MVINGLGQVRFFPFLLKDEEKTDLSIVRYRCMLRTIGERLWERAESRS